MCTRAHSRTRTHTHTHTHATTRWDSGHPRMPGARSDLRLRLRRLRCVQCHVRRQEQKARQERHDHHAHALPPNHAHEEHTGQSRERAPPRGWGRLPVTEAATALPTLTTCVDGCAAGSWPKLLTRRSLNTEPTPSAQERAACAVRPAHTVTPSRGDKAGARAGATQHLVGALAKGAT